MRRRGLGWRFVKKFVHRHHGTILAEGQPGEGAVFVVELPFQQPKPVVYGGILNSVYLDT
jgi:signal transduction histidine kinase